MPLLVQVIKWEIEIIIFGLAGAIALKLLNGEINSAGLLYNKIPRRKNIQQREFSPERVQLLIFTLWAAFYYLTLVLNNPHPGTFPDIPQTWPQILGGSNAVYLGGKAYSRFAKKLNR